MLVLSELNLIKLHKALEGCHVLSGRLRPVGTTAHKYFQQYKYHYEKKNIDRPLRGLCFDTDLLFRLRRWKDENSGKSPL